MRPIYGLSLLLETKRMARSTFYYHLKSPCAEHRHEEAERRITEIFHQNSGRYGYRRIAMQLRNEGIVLNHKTVLRLMRKLGLSCRIRQKRYRSYRGTVGKVAPNILGRDFRAERPYQRLVTDVSQISVGGERCFLSPVLDLFSREIVCYDISDRADMAQIGNMLGKLFAVIDALPGKRDVMMHSDQGWQYQHIGYREALAKHGIVQSMSRKGNCLDNSVMENFFGIMKSELLYAKKFKTMKQFKEELKEYIEWYNNKRIKIKLNGMSPVQSRIKFIKKNNMFNVQL